MKRLLMAVSAILLATVSHAVDFISTDESGQSLKWTFTANAIDVATAGDGQDYQATITAVEPIPVTKAITRIEIPAYLGAYRVTKLGQRVFRAGCTNVTEVVFPEGETDEPTIMLESTTMGSDNTAVGNTAWWKNNRGNSPIVLNNFYLLSCGTNKYNDVSTGNARVICTGAFNANATNKVSISASVADIWIGEGAFDGFAGKELVIPDNVTKISPKPIKNCALDYLKLGNGITELPHDINSTANNHWRDLFNDVKKLELPESIAEIPAFRGGAPDNDPPNQDPSADRGYFQGCTSLTNVILGKAVTKIANRAFSGCTGLKEISVPNTVEEIGDEAFRGCTALERFISFPESLEVMGQAAFQNCSKLGDVKIPEGVTEIRDYCFDGCNALSNLTIGAGVEFIGIQAFQNCRKVIAVEIPESVYMIDRAAFSGCNILTNVTGGLSLEMVMGDAFNGTAFQWCESDKFEVTAIGPFIVGFKGICPAKLDLSGVDALGILNGVFGTRPEALTNITEIVFPESLEYVGQWAFSSIRAVSTLQLPDSLLEIDTGAFWGMTNLSTVTFGSDLERIGAQAFQNCGLIKSLELPDALEVIGNDAFHSCTNLSEIVTFGSALEEIGDDAFHDCWWLKNIELPDSLKTLGADAFQNCSNLNSVVMGDGLARIGNQAFQNCHLLKTVTFGAGLERIGDRAFENCWNLEAAELGDKTWLVGTSAFGFCSNLNEVAASDALMYVRDNAFQDAKFIRDSKEKQVRVGNLIVANVGIAFDAVIEVEDGITGIAEGAFRDCLTSKITLPKSVEYIHSKAFENCTNLNTVVIGNWAVRRKNDCFGAKYTATNPQYNLPGGGTADVAIIISKPGYVYSGNWNDWIPEGTLGTGGATMVVARREDQADDGIWEVVNWTKVTFRTDSTQDGDFVPGQTYTGWLRNGNQVAGTVTVKTGKVDKDGFVKVSVAVQTAGTKKTFTELVPWKEGKLVGRTVLRNVTLGDSWLSGTFSYDGVTYDLEGGTDIGKANPAYFDAFNGRVYAVSFSTGWGGTWQEGAHDLPLVHGDSSLVLTCGKKGKVKVTGMLGDGTKVSASAQAVAGDNGAFVAPICLQLYGGKRGGFTFLAWFYLDEDGAPVFFVDETEGQVGRWVYPLEFAWDPYAYITLNVQAFGEVDKANVSGLRYPEFNYQFATEDPVAIDPNPQWDSVRDVIGIRTSYIGAQEFEVTETAMHDWNNNVIEFFANEKGKWTLPDDNGASKITFMTDLGKYAADVDRLLWNDVNTDAARVANADRAPAQKYNGCFASDGKWIQRLYYESNAGEAALEEDGQILGYYVIDVGLKSKDVGLYQTDADRQQLMTKRNLGGLKLSYAPKNGMYSGSYTLYSVDDIKNPAKPTLRKTKVAVSGVMIDGVGYGTAVAKKLFSVRSHIQVRR